MLAGVARRTQIPGSTRDADHRVRKAVHPTRRLAPSEAIVALLSLGHQDFARAERHDGVGGRVHAADMGVPGAMAAGRGNPSAFARSTISSVSAPPAETPKIAAFLGSVFRSTSR
jgi:hypothetical protein